jgi:hypothetical protein
VTILIDCKVDEGGGWTLGTSSLPYTSFSSAIKSWGTGAFARIGAAFATARLTSRFTALRSALLLNILLYLHELCLNSYKSRKKMETLHLTPHHAFFQK